MRKRVTTPAVSRRFVDFLKFRGCVNALVSSVPPSSSSMASLSDLILAAVPYRLPVHLYSYVPGVSPLSTDTSVTVALVSYLAAIFGIQAYMKDKEPRKLTALFQAHNIFLTTGSGLLLVLMLEEIVPIIWNRGIHAALCHADSWTPVRIQLLPTRSFLPPHLGP